MLFASFGGTKTRHRSQNHTHRTAKQRKPGIEQMEGRQLLTTIPYMQVNSPKVVEGTGGTTTMNFNVTLTSPSTVPITVNYGTAGNTATSGTDFIATSGTLTFAPGETSKAIPVAIVPDSVVESNETLYMALSGATNAYLITPKVAGTIVDDDTAVAPALSIADVTMYRGLDGSKTMTFTVALNAAQSSPVTVTATTANINALAGVDYDANSQVLTFAPGQTTQQFSVTIYGTSTPTADVFFQVNLSSSSVSLARASAAGILKYGA